ncbi:MAG: NosD domain-containing protein, partial [Methanosarcina sp.]
MLLTFLIFTLSSCIGAAKDISVNQGQSIQAAINSAQNGDVILVGPGNYSENIVINRVNVELRSASGNPDDTVITSNETGKNVISVVSRANFKISGFTIKGASTDYSAIDLMSCRDCVVEGNKFVDNALGVYLRSSVNCAVRNNAFSKTNTIGIGRGINVQGSYSTVISGNTVSDHRYGIYIAGSEGSIVSGNTVNQSLTNGIQLENTRNTILESNTVSSSGNKGIFLKDSGKNTLRNNVVSSNKGNGIDIETSSGNTVSGNTISGYSENITNIHGLFINTCRDNVVQSNTMSTCEYGFAMRYSENNSIINNNAHDNTRGYYISYTSSRNTISGNKANSNNIGIVMERGANNNILQNNDASSNLVSGIALDNAYNNRLSNNIASQNSRGIYLGPSSRGNIISNNTLNYNSGDGIRFENATNNELTGNTITSSNNNGIYLAGLSNNNTLINNKAQNNKVGLYIMNSTGNLLSQNMVTENIASGIMLSLASNNTISKNIAVNNIEGVTLNSSESNTILSNNISSNGNGAFLCPRSTSNLFYDNYFNNPSNANVRNNGCRWNIARTSGRNIMGGRYLGGNFWATPSGMGFSETNPDADGDGIIDVPFIPENGNIVDQYPLARVLIPIAGFSANVTDGLSPLTVQFTDSSQNALSWNWNFGYDKDSVSSEKNPIYTYAKPGNYTVTLVANNANGSSSPVTRMISVHNLLPIADFRTNVASGSAPLSVQFTDLSQYAKWRIWYFGDGAASNETNPTHVYTKEGNYNVYYSVSNENGTVSKSATITVQKAGSSGGNSGGSSGGSSHKSSSGSSGGGGAGGSPEPQSNVAVKELSQTYVSSGKPVKFEFTKNATCVVYVSFDSKRSFGKTTTIAEQLKGKSTLVSELPEGLTYKSFNIWVGNGGVATPKNIDNAQVSVKVDKTWIKDKKADQKGFVLNRYVKANKEWEELPTEIAKEDDKYIYLKAKTSEYGSFAITAKEAVKEEQNE